MEEMQTMNIAVGTSDGISMCDHLARSSAFLVFEIADDRAVLRETRQRDSGCGNHKGFVEMLEGCQAVLCGGIGEGAVLSLEAHGIKPVVAVGKHSAEEAVSLYLAGKLATTTERVCLCH